MDCKIIDLAAYKKKLEQEDAKAAHTEDLCEAIQQLVQELRKSKSQK